MTTDTPTCFQAVGHTKQAISPEWFGLFNLEEREEGFKIEEKVSRGEYREERGSGVRGHLQKHWLPVEENNTFIERKNFFWKCDLLPLILQNPNHPIYKPFYLNPLYFRKKFI